MQKRFFRVLAVLVLAAEFAGAGALSAKAASIEHLVKARILKDYGASLPRGAELEVAVVSTGVTHAQQLRSLDYQIRSGHFVGYVEKAGQLHKVFGTAEAMVYVAVPKQTIRAGSVIRDNDLTAVRMAASDLRADSHLHRADLIGREARRILRAGRVIPTRSVGAPTIVDRNAEVSIIYAIPGLKIVGRGQSLEDGGEGDWVRVRNLDSNKIVSARITGPETVTVSN